MQHLLIKEIPKYDHIVACSSRYPDMNPDAIAAFMYILRAGDEVFRAVSRTFRERNISQGRIMLMVHLLDKENDSALEMSHAELADQLCVTRATVSGLVDGLVKDGLARRRPSSTDRRVSKVSLTEDGFSLLEEVLPKHYQLINRLMDVFDPKELRTMGKLMNKLVDHIAEVDPPEAP